MPPCLVWVWDLKTGCVINQQGVENCQQSMRLSASWHPWEGEWCQHLIQSLLAGTTLVQLLCVLVAIAPKPSLTRCGLPSAPSESVLLHPWIQTYNRSLFIFIILSWVQRVERKKNEGKVKKLQPPTSLALILLNLCAKRDLEGRRRGRKERRMGSKENHLKASLQGRLSIGWEPGQCL